MELTLGVRVSHLTKSVPHTCQSYQVKYQLGSETFVWTPPPNTRIRCSRMASIAFCCILSDKTYMSLCFP